MWSTWTPACGNGGQKRHRRPRSHPPRLHRRRRDADRHGAIVLNGARIGSHCLIGAGALVTQSTVIPDGMMALGSPARVKSPLTPEAIASLHETALHYRQEAQELKEQENI